MQTVIFTIAMHYDTGVIEVFLNQIGLVMS